MKPALTVLGHSIADALDKLQHDNFDMALAKLNAYKAASPVRSRVGNAVPTSKSKSKNRAKAKAARKARKK